MKKLFMMLGFLMLLCASLSARYIFDGKIIFSKHGTSRDSLAYLIIEKSDGSTADTFGIVDTLGNVYLKYNIWFDQSDTLFFTTTIDTGYFTAGAGKLMLKGLLDFYIYPEATFYDGMRANVVVATAPDTVESAATIILANYNNFVIRGVADIDSIDTDGAIQNWAIAYIEFTDTASLAGLRDGKNLKIEGNFIYTPNDMIVLQRRGNIFYEISRSVNSAGEK